MRKLLLLSQIYKGFEEKKNVHNICEKIKNYVAIMTEF